MCNAVYRTISRDGIKSTGRNISTLIRKRAFFYSIPRSTHTVYIDASFVYRSLKEKKEISPEQYIFFICEGGCLFWVFYMVTKQKMGH